MASKARYNTKNHPNNQCQWDDKTKTGLEFEKYIYQFIAHELGSLANLVEVKRSPASGDKGRDIIIRSKCGIKLFDLDLKKKEKQLKIYIECKWTANAGGRISNFANNYAQSLREKVNYYILVTNGSLTPFEHETASNNLKANGIEFINIDLYLLSRYLKKRKVSLSESLTIPSEIEPTIVEYQTQRIDGDQVGIQTAVVIRNYSEKRRPCQAFLRTDRNWVSKKPKIKFYLEPWCSRAFMLTAKREHNDGQEHLEFVVQVNGEQHPISVLAKNTSLAFEARYFGTTNQMQIMEIIDLIDHGNGFNLISITGEAGVGKSRLIDEVLKQRNASAILILRVYFGRGRIKEFLKNFQDRVKETFDLIVNESNPAASIKETISNIDNEFMTPVLILEDLHHADPDTLKGIKQILLDQQIKSSARAVFLIITGRNDDTFPNDDYLSLIELIKLEESKNKNSSSDRNIQTIQNHEVLPLSLKDSRNLIRSTIENIPRFALRKITRLGQNIPFNIIQCIEYLLETKMVKIVNRNTVGILNIRTFNSKMGIPSSIETLYSLRLASLEKTKYGKSLARFLHIAAFFGFQIPMRVRNLALEEIDDGDFQDILAERRFIIYDTQDTVRWGHENLLTFFNQRLENRKISFQVSQYIVSYPQIFNCLEPFDQGRVAQLASYNEKAVHLYRPIVETIEKIENYSSVDLDSAYIPYLDSLYSALKAIKTDKVILIKTLLTKAYMGVHHQPLLIGAKNCISARKTLQAIRGISKKEITIYATLLKQLEAHAYMDSGWISKAKKIMLEIEGDVKTKESLKTEYNLHFDLYNRLQDVYRMHNHLHVARSYGKLAKMAAKNARDPQLLAVHFLDDSIVLQHSHPDRCQALLTAALSFSNSCGAERHQTLTEHSLLISLIQTQYEQKEGLLNILQRSRRLFRKCITDSYASSIPRIQLLIGSLHYLLSKWSPEHLGMAERYIDAGIDNAVRYGTGYVSWQLFNLKAIIATRKKEKPDVIYKYFETSIQHMNSESLLFFGGMELIYGNILVYSNYIRFLYEHNGEEDVYQALSKITFYEKEHTELEELLKPILKNIEKYGSLAKPLNQNAIIRDPVTSYALSLCC
ncbi:MAG: restriction endonuclease [SAR324 cluster bacterium]|nr:restriction endonuclease [SAR324 cluster bacterium]